MTAGDSAKKPLITLVGATATGKTGVAIQLAEALDGEIVGADSRQVYRQMAIGTAQPTAAQRARVPHHLIDFITPDDNLTLARYQSLAYAQIDDIHRRGKIPLLVGGTGQYVTAVIDGWSIPQVAPNAIFRAQLEAFARSSPAARDILFRRLQTLDAASAQIIHPNNLRRVIRALEVYEETGSRFSDLRRKKPPPYAILELGLTLERHTLYQRADARVDAMVEAGFVEEVAGLLVAGYDRHLPAMSGLGYSQMAAHLLDGLPLHGAVQDTKSATHDFIRRQLTWYRKYSGDVRWYNALAVKPQALIQVCADWLSEQNTVWGSSG